MPKILVVDDQPETIELLEAYLVPHGYEIVKAANGKEALVKLAGNQIDLMLLDVRMPGIDGFEVTRRVRQDEKNRKLPIILVTVLQEPKDRVKGIEAGCDDFISKPFNEIELLARIRSLLKINAYNYLMSNYKKELESKVTERTEALKHSLENLQQEINDRKRAEEALQEKEQRIRKFLDATSDMAFLKDDSYHHILVNRALCQFYGKPENEVLGKTDFELMDGQAAVECRKTDEQAQCSNDLQISEEVVGSRYYETRKFPVKLADGKKGVGAFIRDVTYLKQSEEELKKSEERFRNLFDNALEGVYQSTPEGRLISANKALSRMFGYETPEEIIKTVTDIGRQMYANPDDRKRAIAIFRERGYIEHFECPMRQKDGSVFWALFSGRVAKTPDGITCLEGFISDISSLKRSEDLLRLKNLVFDTSLAANSIADLAGVITEANDAFLSIWGYSKKDEVVGNPVANFLNDLEEAAAIITALNGKGEWQGDFTAKKKDGSTFIAHSMATVIRDENGQVTGYQSSVVDITDRKQAEEALKESERMLVQTAEIGKVGGWTFDIETRKQTWTKMVYDIHEVDITTYQPTVDKGISFYTPASRPIIERAVQCVIEQGEPFDVELEIITARGNLRNVHAMGRADQACRKVFGFFQDITAHKRVEEALRVSEERFRRMFQNSAISMACVSPDFYFLQVNDALCKMMGYTATELLGKTFQDLTMPEDRQAGSDLVRRVLSGGMKSFELEKRYQHKDGTVIFGKVSATLIRDAMNNPLHFIVHIQDITSRKQAEEEILKLNTNLEQKIKERTTELNKTIAQLEETNRVFVGRELKMAELKERIAELEKKT